jgi:hypothetical protein
MREQARSFSDENEQGAKMSGRKRRLLLLSSSSLVLLSCWVGVATSQTQNVQQQAPQSTAPATPAPVKPLGRVKLPVTKVEKPRSICDVAREARARNSPAAPGLEAQCRATTQIKP